MSDPESVPASGTKSQGKSIFGKQHQIDSAKRSLWGLNHGEQTKSHPITVESCKEDDREDLRKVTLFKKSLAVKPTRNNSVNQERRTEPDYKTSENRRDSVEVIDISLSGSSSKLALTNKKLSMEELTTDSDQDDNEIPYKRYQDIPFSQDSDRTVDYEHTQKSTRNDSQEIVCLDDTSRSNKQKMKKAAVKNRYSSAEPELIDLTEDEDDENIKKDDSFKNSESNPKPFAGNKQNVTLAATSNKDDHDKAQKRIQCDSDKGNEIIVLDDSQVM